MVAGRTATRWGFLLPVPGVNAAHLLHIHLSAGLPPLLSATHNSTYSRLLSPQILFNLCLHLFFLSTSRQQHRATSLDFMFHRRKNAVWHIRMKRFFVPPPHKVMLAGWYDRLHNTSRLHMHHYVALSNYTSGFLLVRRRDLPSLLKCPFDSLTWQNIPAVDKQTIYSVRFNSILRL